MNLGRNKTKQTDASQNDLKKLKRADLLEMLLEQTLEAERLAAENASLKEELEKLRSSLEPTSVSSLNAESTWTHTLLNSINTMLSEHEASIQSMIANMQSGAQLSARSGEQPTTPIRWGDTR